MTTAQQNLGTADACTCSECQAACRHKPGWFKPGEVERVAAWLGLSLAELFHTRLMVDRWRGDGAIFVLSPAIVEGDAGQEFLTTTRGQCVFYQDGLCAIHPVKPYECRVMLHGQPATYHADVAHSWNTSAHQRQVRDLLGREPVADEPDRLTAFLGPTKL